MPFHTTKSRFLAICQYRPSVIYSTCYAIIPFQWNSLYLGFSSLMKNVGSSITHKNFVFI